MRDIYVPLFQDLLDSSLWAKQSPATRCVWIALLLMADADGYVGAALPGIAHRARVSEDEARQAIAILEAPDPDSRTKDHEGRRIVEVERGWHVFNLVALRLRAKVAARRAYKAGLFAKKRAANDYAEPDPRQLSLPFPESPQPPSTDVDTSRQSVGTQKHKPKLLSSEGEGSPSSSPLVLKEIPEGYDFEHLRPEAIAAGVSSEDFDRRIRDLRKGPIGGQRGVFAHKLDDWVRGFFGNWKLWGETERAKALEAKAAPRAASGPPWRFERAPAPVVPLEPEAKHEAFARKHGVDIDAVIQGVLADHPEPGGVSRLAILGERLTVAAKQKRAGHPVTGKLTRAEAQEWGSPPPGGVIPEVA